MENACLVEKIVDGCSTIDFAGEVTEGFAARYIRHKARQLAGKAGLTTSDVPDLEQELTLFLWERLPSYRPERGHWNAFVVTLVERRIATLLESRRCQKRYQLLQSINASPSEPDEGEAGRVYRNPYWEGSDYADQAAVELQHDVAVITAKLPRLLRWTCEWLASGSVPETASMMRVSRTTIYARIKRLRAAFAVFDPQES